MYQAIALYENITLITERPIVNVAFIKAASSNNTAVLELFADEFGNGLSDGAVNNALVMTCAWGDAITGKILVNRFSNRPYDFGQDIPKSLPMDEAWALLVEALRDTEIL